MRSAPQHFSGLPTPDRRTCHTAALLMFVTMMKTDKVPKSRKSAALKVHPFMGASRSNKKCTLLLCAAISALFLVSGCLAQGEISSGGPSFTITDGDRSQVSAVFFSLPACL